jgi:predicted PurR-regulated permease PerM
MPEVKLPFYAKSTIILFGLILFVIVLYFLQSIVIPFAFATILAILLNPVNNFLQRLRLPRLLTISITVLIAILMVTLLFYFLTVQMAQFGEALPQLRARFSQYLTEVQGWLVRSYNISAQKQLQWLNTGLSNAFENGGAIIGQTLSAVTSVAVILTILPVYIFLLLLYKPLLVEFIKQVFSTEHSEQVGEILKETKAVIQSYIVGLLIEAAIIAVLNSIGLLLLGINYAILLGVIGAILNIVPYIGGLIAILLPMLIALITKEDGVAYAIGVVAVYIVIQFIDNNIIVPKIVASKVRINAIISIIAVLAGGALWGVPGMFLSIPFVAVLKIIFDRVESLRPWGMLLGDDIPGQKQHETLSKRLQSRMSKRTTKLVENK